MGEMAEELKARPEDPKFVAQTFATVSEDDYKRESVGVPIRCHYCVGQSFRRSRLRSSDILSLFLMRYPVRCLRCSQRQMVSFTLAGLSLSKHVRPRRKRMSSTAAASETARTYGKTERR